jgi:hypothetical protein
VSLETPKVVECSASCFLSPGSTVTMLTDVVTSSLLFFLKADESKRRTPELPSRNEMDHQASSAIAAVY